MNNYDDIKCFISELSNFLNSIPPYLYSLYATFFAYLISSFLDLNAMSALGNWLEQVGQILLTITAQASATPSDEEYNNLVNEVKYLKEEIEKLKNN
jgi:hypothetical protein